MGLRELFGNLLMKAGDSLPTPTRRVIADPFNFAVDCVLRKSYPVPAVLLAEVRTAFPAIAQDECDALSRKLDLAQRIAVDLASAVNKRQLTQQEARERLGQAVPELDAANLSRLLMQNLIGTR